MSHLLQGIDDPRELRRLAPEQLPGLARELREFLLQTVARTGGHLSSNLGTVELTLALHYVFDTPHDRLVWDVGHQTYAHKILTGRRDRMGGLRQRDGISGFPRRDESPYDTFGTAHSSTSISAGLGLALAARAKGERRKVVAVIGDGAMTGGMAFEALNNVGVHPEADLLIVLNDNDMSISAPVGALNRYLARLLSGRFYASARDAAKQVLKVAPPPLLALARRLEEQAKGLVAPGTLFEEFGVDYVGPIDGHDLHALVPTLQNLRERSGPRLLHVVTRKGYGYKLAEADPITYHGPGRFDPAVGIKPPAVAPRPTFAQVFGQWLCDMAKADARLMAVTPAMCEGSGMVEYAARFPQRYFDVGIAEQHAVTFAAGLACEGMRPVVAIYSSFLQRGYDQLVHDVALQNLPVTFAIDRAGLVGGDGATHQGSYDLSFLRCLPNIVVMAPSNEDECRQMLHTATTIDGPAAVRYPRGTGPGITVQEELRALPVGRAVMLREGHTGVALLAFGSLVASALEIGKELDATVVNMRFVKPIDEELINRLAATHARIVTIEENVVAGGAGSAVAEVLNARGHHCSVLQIGIPDQPVAHGSREDNLVDAGLDLATLRTRILAWARPQGVRRAADAAG